MSTPTPMRVAGVGAGYFSRFHYDSWQRLPQVTLEGVCDRDLRKAEAVGANAFDDLQEMLEAVNPDLLDVILPPDAHGEAIHAGIGAGVRWIVCQKPFCTGPEEAQAVVDAAQAAGVTLVVHENFRFQPWYRAIKSALDRGVIGELHQVTFRLRPGDGQGPEAYLHRQPYFQQMTHFLVRETAVHWVDTFRYLLGEPISVYADLRRMNPAIAGEDAGHILFQFPGGVRALFDGNRHLDHATDNPRRTMGEALIEGADGTLTLKGDGSVLLRRFGACAEDELLPPDLHDGFGGDCVHGFQSHVVRCWQSGDRPETLAEDYLRVVEIEAAIYASDDTGAKIGLGG
ncbi:MAG: Gfo/Idh/MocA family oxidoreductase [Pseudomonadota bacterium]